FTIDAADSYPGRFSGAPVTWTGETLPSGRLVDVFEVELLLGGGYKVKATNLSGGADLVVDIHPPSATSLDFSTAEFHLDEGSAGENELALISPAENGRYVFIVHKKGSGDKALNAVYDFSVTFGASGVGEEETPTAFALRRNVPNPFNPMTVIKYELPVADNLVTLEIFSISGQRIRTLVSEIQPAGYHEVTWNGRTDTGEQVSTGVYFYRLKAGSFQRTEKMTLLK
ncbi:MAG: T9SS type A sorting domain-containing protein, partial [Gemmatimonadales bacterium]|nr:T9SS type A sorting domain-containing protein [Gemmatimonadales bacterium]